MKQIKLLLETNKIKDKLDKAGHELNRVLVTNENGENAIGKPIGNYITIDINKLKVATDEEIERDYQNDLKEMSYDKVRGKGKYTRYEHDCLVQRVNAFNKENDLPIVNF